MCELDGMCHQKLLLEAHRTSKPPTAVEDLLLLLSWSCWVGELGKTKDTMETERKGKEEGIVRCQ